MKTNRNQLQQGDVIAVKVDKLPPNCKPIKVDGRGFVLAEGETTGHSHIMEVGENEFVESEDGKRFLVVNESKLAVHEEHHPIEFSPGIWQIDQVQEKDWLSGMANIIKD